MSTTFRNVLSKNNGSIRICEVHDRASTELVRDSVADNGQAFDGTTILGVPDTELISPLTRASLATPVYKPLQNNGRPLCAAFDADSGGDVKDIPALVSVLELKGVSMVVIEDKALGKPGEKVNSLLATSDKQGQANPQEFANVIRAFKQASKDKDVMVTARIESFTTRVSSKEEQEEKQSVDAALSDAQERAKIYCQAGADGIMIHCKSKDPSEILRFLRSFRDCDKETPLVMVPTSYSKTHRSVLADAGANVFIYANHLLRAKISAASIALEVEHGQKLNFSVGGGGVSSSIAIIVSDLVSLRSRGKYQGFISLAIGTGAASGPFVAASLIQTHSQGEGWKWAFWVPSIIAACCFALLLFLLPLKPVTGSLSEKVRKIDWLGVVTLIPAIVLVVMSINSGGSIWPWKDVKTIVILVIVILFLILFIAIEAFVAKMPIIPLRLLATRSASVLILFGFLYDFVWQITQYFIPLYF
ncbi:hypothetical protein NW768_012191 [Fusarium equiseti]|uniref:Phosphoenolpyruvate phosphomutase n=1 Tax=Fusarium equiseti TaxID=61235 RepID=A0ABQ8QVV9_FUSEQ|nr:hypothetical protein NW768_012191 [Fusarium equiseti]